jgi:hypothetical protein
LHPDREPRPGHKPLPRAEIGVSRRSSTPCLFLSCAEIIAAVTMYPTLWILQSASRAPHGLPPPRVVSRVYLLGLPSEQATCQPCGRESVVNKVGFAAAGSLQTNGGYRSSSRRVPDSVNTAGLSSSSLSL